MNINLFQVNRDNNAVELVDLLTNVSALTLEQRIRPISFGQMRLDVIAPPASADNASPYWLLDFTKLRFDHGPGRVGRSTVISGFDLQDDEGFGEETAALYDAEHNYMLVQYNHHGVRAASIEAYLNAIAHLPEGIAGYNLAIKMDPSAEARLAQKNFITKIRYKVATAKLTEAHREAGVSLRQALALTEEQRGSTIEITISAARGENLFTESARNTINALKRLVAADQQQDTRVITQFEIEGRQDVLDRADAVNMLTPKLNVAVDGLLLGGDRRYTRRSRWDGLLRARQGWRQIIE